MPTASPSAMFSEARGYCWRHLRQGFTLIEILVVIAIITIMAALAIPAVMSLSSAGSVTTASYDISGRLKPREAMPWLMIPTHGSVFLRRTARHFQPIPHKPVLVELSFPPWPQTTGR